MNLFSKVGANESVAIDVFENPSFEEHLRAVGPMRFKITSVEHDPNHPKHPVINFKSGLEYVAIKGHVRMTPDNHVRWHLVSDIKTYLIAIRMFKHCISRQPVNLMTCCGGKGAHSCV